MGLSNFNKYRLTAHAVERYRERFNPSESEAAITSKVKSWLAQADFLSSEQRNTQAWFNNENNTVFIVSPKDFKVITLYSTLGEFRRKKEEKLTSEQGKVHPFVEQMVSELVESKVFSVKSKYYSELATIYADYADRMDKLSRTMREDRFEQKSKELEEVRGEIQEIEEEFASIINSMMMYIQK